jgi:hypothetical protein
LEDEEDLEWDGRPTFKMPSCTTPMPQWAFDKLTGPPGYDSRMFKNILLDATLKQYVREVQIYTCDIGCDFHPARARYWYGGYIPELEFDPLYHECVGRLGEFPDVRNITIHFDRHASRGQSSYGKILQDSAFQREWLSQILRSVNHNATELAVRHYKNSSPPENDLILEDFAKVTSLRLSIKHEETNRLSVGPTYKVYLLDDEGSITDTSSVETSILSGKDFPTS